MARPVQVTFDCADPGALAGFWADALDYEIQPPPDGFDSWDDALRAAGVPEEQWNTRSAAVDPDGRGPRLFFQQVPEGKTAKNRVHLDLQVSGGRHLDQELRRTRIEAEVERLVAAGASVLRREEARGGLDHVVMADPEGNEFCVV